MLVFTSVVLCQCAETHLFNCYIFQILFFIVLLCCRARHSLTSACPLCIYEHERSLAAICTNC